MVPSLARDAHASKIDDVIHEALKNAQMTIDDVDAIGVTVGPGLEICLRVGCNAAKELAIRHKKPFVGVHHLEAHVLMARIGEGVKIAATAETHESSRGMDFPFLALLVSGGHCQLMKCYGVGNYSIIGGTLDDSLGKRSRRRNENPYIHLCHFSGRNILHEKEKHLIRRRDYSDCLWVAVVAQV